MITRGYILNMTNIFMLFFICLNFHPSDISALAPNSSMNTSELKPHKIKSILDSVDELSTRNLTGPFHRYQKWIDDILQDTDEIFDDLTLKMIADHLQINDQQASKIVKQARTMAKRSSAFYQSMVEGPRNIYLMRDSMALYACEKIFRNSGETFFLSKQTFRSFTQLASYADLFVLLILEKTLKEFGLKINDKKIFVMEKGLEEIFYEKFKNNLIEVLQSQGGQIIYEKNSFELLIKYIVSLLEKISPDQTIRIVDTTEKGTLVIFLKSMIDLMREGKIDLPDSVSDIEFPHQVEGYMAYSRYGMFPSFSEDLDQSPSIEYSYPVKAKVMPLHRQITPEEILEYFTENGEPKVDEIPTLKKSSLFLVIVLRNKFLKLKKQEQTKMRQPQRIFNETSIGIAA